MDTERQVGRITKEQKEVKRIMTMLIFVSVVFHKHTYISKL